MRRINEQKTPESHGKVSKLKFDVTPEFLRRDHQRALITVPSMEDGVSCSPIAARMPVKPAGRGLSALVKGLRNMEDEKLDEEMDMLREMEADENGLNNSSLSKRRPTLFIQDSQLEMPLGPDGEGEETSDGADVKRHEKGQNGKPLRLWKKKGQKRSTRQVKMKPNIEKWKPEPEWKKVEDSEDELAPMDTQIEEGISVHQLKSDNEKDYSDDEGSLNKSYSESGDKELLPEEMRPQPAENQKVKTKPPRKIAATANPNFRALKIKNKQSKGKRGGRFGRRR